MEEKERIAGIISEFEKRAIAIATNFEDSAYEDYENARNNILAEPLLYRIIPEWIVKNRHGSQFRGFMQQFSGHYAPRREFIRNSIYELMQCIERGAIKPVSFSFEEAVNSIKNSRLENHWKKIQSRRDDDPEGAITASRTMLESTFKYILDESREDYTSKDDLIDLYKKVSQKLNLSPGNHAEKTFKQILQGVSSVVVGFGTLRNLYGDAHGKGKGYVEPARRHADFVINLSGTICTFLIETFSAQKKKMETERAIRELQDQKTKIKLASSAHAVNLVKVLGDGVGKNVIITLPDNATPDMIYRLSRYLSSCPKGDAKVFLHHQGNKLETTFSISLEPHILKGIEISIEVPF